MEYEFTISRRSSKGQIVESKYKLKEKNRRLYVEVTYYYCTPSYFETEEEIDCFYLGTRILTTKDYDSHIKHRTTGIQYRDWIYGEYKKTRYGPRQKSNESYEEMKTKIGTILKSGKPLPLMCVITTNLQSSRKTEVVYTLEPSIRKVRVDYYLIYSTFRDQIGSRTLNEKELESNLTKICKGRQKVDWQYGYLGASKEVEKGFKSPTGRNKGSTNFINK